MSKVDFVDAAVLDVSGLDVGAGAYKVDDAVVVGETTLRFARGTDIRKWNLESDLPEGNLLLTFSP